MLVHSDSNYLKIKNKIYIQNGNLISEYKIYDGVGEDFGPINLFHYSIIHVELDFSHFISNEVIDNFVLNFPIKSVKTKDLNKVLEDNNLDKIDILFNVLDKSIDFSNINEVYNEISYRDLRFNYGRVWGKLSITADSL